LPTEAEYEYAARANTVTARFWGVGPKLRDEGSDIACDYANVADATLMQSDSICNDGARYTSKIGKYHSNGFGLYDMMGNVSEWVEDCYHENYAGAPNDGTAWVTGDCNRRVLRGGSWAHAPGYVRSAYREESNHSDRANTFGFRLVRAD
jgi:sulfatase modifying factor 1